MKPFLLLLLVLLFGVNAYSQAPKIRFEYDSAGNQIQRSWCTSCSARNSIDIIKEVTDLEDSDLKKFFPEDVISYYPNPVKEELYLKWELINGNKVAKMEIINLNGQIIKSYNRLEKENSKNISFHEFAIGIYFVNLYYTNGEYKSIKIIKN
jgi:hypothetical protein